MDEEFKKDVQYRLCKLGVSQNEFAYELGICKSYFSQIVNSVRDTPAVRCKKELILKKLDEMESESGCPIEK